MQKNTKTYLLLALVLIVWGLIGYKIINWMPDKVKEVPSSRPLSFKPKKIQERDKFSIVADYRDPFLETAMKTETKPKKTNTNKTVVTQPTIDIKYSGFITDGNSQQKIFFVTINGQQHMMKLKDKIADVTLISGSTETIKVSYQNKRITLSLEK
ncbi:hypothetical protein [Cellulophaga sp. Hel_I_12]|uniref:hypothetical protein n=1 Tax=Cellulophaga sp. Hel_I_12 TaxID=1249972 RepID=UPI0006489B42|nr:hypothetical protein [Cellulophaga sp. Hel_I_12]